MLFTLIGMPWFVLPLVIIMKASPMILLNPVVLLFFAFWYGVSILVFFGSPLYSLLVWKNMYYLLTDRYAVKEPRKVYEIINQTVWNIKKRSF